MAVPLFSIVASSVKRFNEDKCWTSAIVISYFTFLCAIPLIALAAYVTARVLGSSEIVFRGLNIFTDEFFAKLDPGFLTKIRGLGMSVTNLGLFGLGGSFVAASFLFSNLISCMNQIFRTKYHKSFFYNRLMEYLLMTVIGILMFLSLSITAVWTALQRSLRESAAVADYINPGALALVNNFFIQYLMPYGLTFLVLFTLYKFIPEVKVNTKGAAIAAAVAALFWEVFKRMFAFYVANLSAVGIVLSKLLAGTLTSIIFFLLWISFSLVILLWGAELAAVLNERRTAHAS
ncbi:MAG: YihY/virulence factor BrkB family protein [Candidatus Aminicenantes bacterium]|nr:YihY/virulence factor BrkB family protein [Candidatus Aminicenantes bacterium]